MRTLSPPGNLRLAVFVIATVAVTGSASVAGDPATRQAERTCEWRGTAPICEGRCEPGEINPQSASDADDARYERFGASCITGVKTYCCKLHCPGGWVLSGNECVELQDSGVPVGPQIITPPQGPVEEIERKKGPITAPTPLEGTVLEKGPITAPEPPPPPPPPFPKTATVVNDADVYEAAGGGGVKGVLRSNDKTTKVSLVEPCQNNWCHVKGDPVPDGEGWVYSGTPPDFQSLQF